MSRRDGITTERLLELATAAERRTLTTAEAVLLRTGITSQEEARLSAVGQQEALTLARKEIEQLQARPTVDDLRAVYRERANLVAFLTALWPSVIILDGDPDAPGWALVYVDSPNGQLSWHLSGDDLDLFPHVQRAGTGDVTWDNHTTEEKYERIRQQTAALAKFPMEPFRQPGCGPDCADGHMYDGYCTEDPHLEGVTTAGNNGGDGSTRSGAAWRCDEDDGCGHLSLGHTNEAAARRSYDRHRACQCPRTDPFQET